MVFFVKKKITSGKTIFVVVKQELTIFNWVSQISISIEVLRGMFLNDFLHFQSLLISDVDLIRLALCIFSNFDLDAVMRWFPSLLWSSSKTFNKSAFQICLLTKRNLFCKTIFNRKVKTLNSLETNSSLLRNRIRRFFFFLKRTLCFVFWRNNEWESLI